MSVLWLSVIAVTVAASLVTAWMMVAALLPSLRLRDAATVNLGSSAVANTVPGGGAVAMGVSWAMLSSWGVASSEYVRYTLVSGIWNVFVRLGLPVVALLLLVLTGRSGPGSQTAAYAGAGVLVLLAVLFRATLRSEPFARRADQALARALTAGCRLARRPPPRRAAGLLLEFRAGAAGLLARRGLRITATTVASHLTLWLVLLACLRASGLSQAQVSWQASLAAFAFARLLSVLPITPGGLGVIEVGVTTPLIAGLARPRPRRWPPPCCCSASSPTCCLSRSVCSPSSAGGTCTAGAPGHVLTETSRPTRPTRLFQLIALNSGIAHVSFGWPRDGRGKTGTTAPIFVTICIV